MIKNPNVATRLACWADGRSTVKDMALVGFHALVDASLPSDGCSPDREQESTVDLRQLSQRLGDFWHRLRIPPLGVTGDSADYVEAFERKAGFALDQTMREAPLMRGAAVARLHVLGHSVLEVSKVDLLGRRFDVEGLNDLVRRLELVGASYWRRRLPEHDMCISYGVRPAWDAESVAQACLSVLQDQLPQAEITSLDVAALALVGALQRQVAMTTRCSACFRWSEPGSCTCAEHRPLDPFDGDSDSPRARRIERSRELANAIYGERCRHGEVVYERCVGSRNWLRRTLWPVADARESETVDALMPLVASLPDLLEAMHTTAGRLRRDSLLLRLQRHIDPLEIRPAAWMDLVQLADAWLGAEALGSGPQWGGPALSTIAKIREAMEVAARTGEGRNAVAKSIGVHPTLISHWVRRFQVDVIPPENAAGKRRQ